MHSNRKIASFPKAPDRPMPALVDLQLEAQVVGAVLYDNLMIKEALFLEPNDFSEPVHAELWDMISKLQMNGQAATPATIALHLGDRLDVIGGRDFLSGLTTLGEMIAPALKDAANRVRELAQWRRLSHLGSTIQDMIGKQNVSPDEAFSALLREAETAIQSGKHTARPKSEVARTALSEARQQHRFYPTGIDQLDFLMHGGLIKRRMYGIGGHLGRGKTILIGTISENLNARKVPHLIISFETPPEDVEIRNCARQLDLNAAQIFDQADPLHARFVHNADAYIAQMEDYTYYEYMPGATLDDVHRAIIRASHRYGIEGVIIDYWQLIEGQERGEGPKDHLRKVANRLAALFRRENLWGLVAAQTDENGRLEISEWLKVAASLYVRLQRDENDDVAFFVTEKSNYTRYADGGSHHVPSMIFDPAGPHFRNPEAQDYTMLQMDAEKGGDLDI